MTGTANEMRKTTVGPRRAWALQKAKINDSFEASPSHEIASEESSARKPTPRDTLCRVLCPEHVEDPQPLFSGGESEWIPVEIFTRASTPHSNPENESQSSHNLFIADGLIDSGFNLSRLEPPVLFIQREVKRRGSSAHDRLDRQNGCDVLLS